MNTGVLMLFATSRGKKHWQAHNEGAALSTQQLDSIDYTNDTSTITVT
jgi:hypothetical protein